LFDGRIHQYFVQTFLIYTMAIQVFQNLVSFDLIFYDCLIHKCKNVFHSNNIRLIYFLIYFVVLM
jgi:hypothetical protein